MRYKVYYDQQTEEMCYVVRIKKDDLPDDHDGGEFERPAVFEQECNLVALAFLDIVLREKIAPILKDLPSDPRGRIAYGLKNRVPAGSIRKV